MKNKIGIVGSGLAGAFNKLPKELIERDNVVIIDTVVKTIEPSPGLDSKAIEWQYARKRSRHAGQPWAQRRGKNRKGGNYGY